jgi:hypothetical protein
MEARYAKSYNGTPTRNGVNLSESDVNKPLQCHLVAEPAMTSFPLQ